MAAHRRNSAGPRSQLAKDSDSGRCRHHDLLLLPGYRAITEQKIMAEKTCAACDCALDAHAVSVTIGGKAVEVCCDECATKLKEAHAAASATVTE
jgi:hypothetical protein